MTVKKGRPPFVPTLEQREIVERMRAVGEDQKVIAAAVGIDVATLKRHFGQELLTGHASRRREVVGMLFEAAAGGNVSAIKHLELLTRTPEKPAAVKPETVGKKAAADAAAHDVEARLKPPSAPALKLVQQ